MSELHEKPDIHLAREKKSSDRSSLEYETLKLDQHGLPLRPQPSDDPLGICSTTEFPGKH